MKKILILILFFFVTNLFAFWVSVSEPENMKKIDGKSFYVITKADEFAWFAEQVNSGKTTINAILANDIVFGKDTTTRGENFEGSFLRKYNGILDGNGHFVFGLSIWSGDFIGVLSNDGVIKNISFKKLYSESFVKENWGRLEYITMYDLESNSPDYFVYKNNGLIDHCTYYGNGESFVNENGSSGVISYCKVFDGSYNNGTIVKLYNYGSIKYCISEQTLNKSNGYLVGYEGNYGAIQWSYSASRNSYWLNNKEVQSTAENMQRDQFAWILNTSNGTEENSGVWTRGTDGYPTFANEDSLAIHKVVFDDDGTTSNRYTNYKGLVSFPENPEPPEGFIFSGWYNAEEIKVKPTTVFTADQTVKAVYTDASDVFWTITFYNAAPADTVLESKSYQHGSIVAYGGETPTLTATAKYTYTFKGWDVEPTNAVEDFDYHAVYDSTIRSYTVTFNNTDGSKIESATFEYGKMPSCSKTPTRDATVEWKYSHKGWKPALDYVTEAATYTAIYDSSKVEYKVTFMNGTTVIDEQMVAYGDAAVAPTNVTREGYKFVGWNTSFAKVTEALTVKALFEELVIRTVSVVNADGDKIDNVKVEDGEKYTLPEAPKKDGYTFDAYYNGNKKLGVAGDEISVTANITIVAKYIENPKSSSSSAPKSSSSVKSSSSAKSSSSVVKSSSSGSKKVSSSSTVRSSSSKGKSSSSKKSDAIVSNVHAPAFSLQVQARSIQISAAPINSVYAIFDMQGRVLENGRVSNANFNIALPRAGSYLVKIDNQTRKVNIR